MKRNKYRLWLLSALSGAALVATFLAPALANAAPAATHSGRWGFPSGASKATPSYHTKNTARTCVRATRINSNNRWKFQLVWYDGGKNIRLYTSPIFGSVATHCSPTKKIPRNNDKVYDIITVLPFPGAGPYGGGTYSIATN